jgi:hypothetical protein
MYLSLASINILTDVMILVMPLRTFGQLKMHRNRRCTSHLTHIWILNLILATVALQGIFTVGGIAVVASIVRLYALWVYKTTKDVAYDAIYVRLPSIHATQTQQSN